MSGNVLPDDGFLGEPATAGRLSDVPKFSQGLKSRIRLKGSMRAVFKNTPVGSTHQLYDELVHFPIQPAAE